MDSIDYYDRYAVPYYEETVNLSMEEQLQIFMELLKFIVQHLLVKTNLIKHQKMQVSI